jgi:predicted ABC-type ATPase
LAVARVALRVQQGGHNVPETTIRQRYHRSVENFFQLYRPVVKTWQVYDSSHTGLPELIASGHDEGDETIRNAVVWEQIRKGLSS